MYSPLSLMHFLMRPGILLYFSGWANVRKRLCIFWAQARSKHEVIISRRCGKEAPAGHGTSWGEIDNRYNINFQGFLALSFPKRSEVVSLALSEGWLIGFQLGTSLGSCLAIYLSSRERVDCWSTILEPFCWYGLVLHLVEISLPTSFPRESSLHRVQRGCCCEGTCARCS